MVPICSSQSGLAEIGVTGGAEVAGGAEGAGGEAGGAGVSVFAGGTEVTGVTGIAGIAEKTVGKSKNETQNEKSRGSDSSSEEDE